MPADDWNAPAKPPIVASDEPNPIGKLMEITGGQDGTVKPDGTFVPAVQPAAEIIDQWFSETFPGSPVSGVTAIWNFVFAAKDDLKRRFAAKES